MLTKYDDLKGKTVLITGVSSGIGHAQAMNFLRNDCKVIGLDRDECDIKTDNFTFKKCDLTDGFNVFTTLNCVYADIVCNTAGILDDYRPIAETSVYEWQNVMNVNLNSQFYVESNMLPKMVADRHGVFINMASIAGLIAGGGGAAYTASKHAIIGLTKQLNYDYAKYGIRANCIAPGAVKTKMTESDFNNGGEIASKVIDHTPANRYANAKEIADLSLFLASDVSSYMYGETVTVDGGWSIDKPI